MDEPGSLMNKVAALAAASTVTVEEAAGAFTLMASAAAAIPIEDEAAMIMMNPSLSRATKRQLVKRLRASKRKHPG